MFLLDCSKFLDGVAIDFTQYIMPNQVIMQTHKNRLNAMFIAQDHNVVNLHIVEIIAFENSTLCVCNIEQMGYTSVSDKIHVNGILLLDYLKTI